MTAAMPIAGIWVSTEYPHINGYLCHDRPLCVEDHTAARNSLSNRLGRDGGIEQNVNMGS